ncbi:hypothetical protein FH972_003351 [Carpinus fangiana]|uniref:Uncharacterized protein n=1 Tax=Carpinus fangiana TaxID=176857 RepID=A0A5N6QHP3_9ROSI|nr:hypothetical protein FH972_003351 [Carpinus fangiana]
MATTHEKQKKGFMSIYKSAAGNHIKPVPEPPAVVDKRSIQRNWSLLRKSKTCKGIEQGGRRVAEAGGVLQGGLVEARKSVSHVETNLASVAAFLQVKVLVSDMPGFMQVHAFRCARCTYDSLEKFSSKHMAFNLKKVCFKHFIP